MDFASILNNWQTYLEQQGKSAHTIAAYTRALQHLNGWNNQQYGTPFEPDKFIPRDIRDWQAHQQTEERAAPATINQRLVAASRFFQWAVANDLARKDPTLEIRTLYMPQRRPKGLSQQELRRLLRAVHSSGNRRDIAIVEVLAGTGIRVGELLDLQVGDVEINERSGKLTVRRGKGGQYREVPLTNDVRHALTDYLDEQQLQNRSEEMLWQGKKGPLKNRSTIMRMLHKYAEQAGIRDFGPHVLRHTFATRYLKANPQDLRGLAALLGHASLNTVMIYTEPTFEDLAERMQKTEY